MEYHTRSWKWVGKVHHGGVWGEKPKQWDRALSQAKFAYNNSVNRSTGKSPFAIVYYMPPKHALDLVALLKLPGASQVAKNMADHIQAMQEEVR